MNEECDYETLPTGSMKEMKEALRRHGEESGSTREATRQWLASKSIRSAGRTDSSCGEGGERRGEHVEHRTLDEDEG